MIQTPPRPVRMQRLKVLLCVGVPGLMPPMIGTMYLPALKYIGNDLNTTDNVLALTISLYTLVVGEFFFALIDALEHSHALQGSCLWHGDPYQTATDAR